MLTYQKLRFCYLLKNGPLIQIVRNYRNKPCWLPIAKSKRFILPKDRRLPAPEELELQKNKFDYQIYMNSLSAFQTKIHNEKHNEMVSSVKELNEEAEYAKILEENERENERVRLNREKIRAEEWPRIQSEILRDKYMFEIEEEAKTTVMEDKLYKELNRLNVSISKEQLDEYIEKILSEEKDFNYAIDKDGNKIMGRFNNKLPDLEKKLASLASL